MKDKKQLATVKELMEQGHNALQIASKTGLAKSTVYTYMTLVRKHGANYAPKYKIRKKKLTPVNKAEKPKANPEAQVPPTIQAVYDEMGRLRNMLLDKDAIIRYLENKIALVFSAK